MTNFIQFVYILIESLVVQNMTLAGLNSLRQKEYQISVKNEDRAIVF